MQLALAEPLITTTGIASPGVEAAYLRAQELFYQLGEPPQLSYMVLLMLALFHMVRGELKPACAQGERFLHLAQRDGNSTQLLQAHLACGASSLFLGILAPALEHLTQGSRLYDPQHHHALISIYGIDLGVYCRAYLAFALFCLGYPNQALQTSAEALTLARRLTHPHTIAFALTWVAMVYHGRRDAEATLVPAEESLVLTREQGFPYWEGAAMVSLGWVLAMQGTGAAGCEQIRRGVAVLRATGAVLSMRLTTALLAEASLQAGETGEGLATVNEMLRTLDQPGERLWDAELYRLKGELILAQSSVQSQGSRVKKNQKAKGKGQKSKVTDPRSLNPEPHAEAEACFLKALEVARHQGAKLWELRAATSLARLWQQQGKREAALQLLTEIYQWFTEGFDTKDLQEAKALLEELT